jgi:hypothetical protein
LAAASPLFSIERGRIRLADSVFVYLERTLAPLGPLEPGVTPRAYGVAPTAVSPLGWVVAAVALGEAVWLGFQAVHPAQPTLVRVRVNGLEPLDAVTGGLWDEALAEAPRNYLVCPPDYCLPGLRRPAGYLPFGLREGSPSPDVLEELTLLTCGATPAVVAVRLVRPATFTRLTGVVPTPPQEDSAYKGWRLP